MPDLATILLTAGDHASRPVTPTPGVALYSCTEHDLIYRWDGATWVTWASLVVTAADVTYAGSAGLAAGTVEGALGELDTEKSPAGHTHEAAVEPEALIVAVSDETTAITTGAGKTTFRMPFAMTLTAVRASLTTASTAAGPVTVDINEGGASILSTKLTVDDTEKTSITAVTAPVISDAALADDAEITIDVDTAGTGAKGLKVTLIGART